MFKHLSKGKWLLGAIALLIVAGGVVLLWKYRENGGGTALVMQAWQATLQGSGGNEAAIDVPYSSSSDLSGSSGQAAVGTGSGAEAPASWPTSIAPSAAKESIKVAAAKDSGPKSSGQVALVASSSATILPGVSSTAASVSALPQWCNFAGGVRGDAAVLLNEIAWMGSTHSANDEWLELKNISGKNIDIGSWQVQDQSGSMKIIFAATSTIAQGGFFLLTRGTNYSGALSNTGDWLKIFDADCRMVDELNAASGWSAGNNTTKQTLERDVAGIGWHTSVAIGGSPNAQNSVLTSLPLSSSAVQNSSAQSTSQNSGTTQTSGSSTTTSTSSSESSENNSGNTATTTTVDTNTPTATSTTATTTTETSDATSTVICDIAITYPLIAAIQITGGVGATDNDYIKIYNPTSARIDLSAWKLRKRTKTGTESSIKVFANSSGIAPGGYFTWANSVNGFSASIGADASSTQTLSNDNSIALLNASDTIIDALAWGSGHTTPYIEGQAYPTNPTANQALKRKITGGVIQDSDNNALDFSL